MSFFFCYFSCVPVFVGFFFTSLHIRRSNIYVKNDKRENALFFLWTKQKSTGKKNQHFDWFCLPSFGLYGVRVKKISFILVSHYMTVLDPMQTVNIKSKWSRYFFSVVFSPKWNLYIRVTIFHFHMILPWNHDIFSLKNFYPFIEIGYLDSNHQALHAKESLV